jgi:BirA family biotin operon repressor/biotin-[acetyl-CoA-carboxylase] ligase
MYDDYSEGRIRAALGAGRFGAPLHYFEVAESTQRIALDLAERGCPEGALVVADGQSAGVGRRGRPWHSARGLGIWASLVLRPPVGPREGGLISAWAALAVLRGLESGGWGGVGAGIKWPNDLLVDDRKLCGILVDAKSAGEELKYAVLGLGLNVNHDRGDYPPDIAGTAVSLKMVGEKTGDRATLLGLIAREMERAYPDLLTEDGRKSVASEAQDASVLIGRRVTVAGPGGAAAGTALRIDPDGALVIVTGPGREERILAGDVEIVRVMEDES